MPGQADRAVRQVPAESAGLRNKEPAPRRSCRARWCFLFYVVEVNRCTQLRDRLENHAKGVAVRFFGLDVRVCRGNDSESVRQAVGRSVHGRGTKARRIRRLRVLSDEPFHRIRISMLHFCDKDNWAN